MSERAKALADRFEQANNALIAAVEGCSDAAWQSTCGPDPRTVGVVAHHTAGGHTGIWGLAQAAAMGQPVPAVTAEMIDKGNEQHAAQHADCTKQETIALLRSNGAAAASALRGLSDEQLDRGAGQYGTTQKIIENILIGHVEHHLGDMRAAGV